MKRMEVKEGRMKWLMGSATVLIGLLLMLLYIYAPVASLLMEIVCFLTTVVITVTGVIICLSAYHHKLLAEDMKIQYTNWFGKKIVFSLDEIGYAQTAYDLKSGKDELKLYDLLGKKTATLTYQMKGSYDFLQYLADNQVKIEAAEDTKKNLSAIFFCKAICAEEMKGMSEKIYEEAKNLAADWLRKNKKLGVTWQMGLVTLGEKDWLPDKQFWEQPAFFKESGQDIWQQAESASGNLPEGYVLALEGYLRKNEEYIINQKNEVTGIYIPIIRVTKSMQVGEALRIRFYESALQQMQEQLEALAYILPRNKYHTEKLTMAHPLEDVIR